MTAPNTATSISRTTPNTRAARLQCIRDLLAAQSVRSQATLAALLADRGIEVTQATVSRDLVHLGAVRVRGTDGTLIYAVAGTEARPGERGTGLTADQGLAKVAAEVLVAADASANLVVLRTPPGAANYLASALDHSDTPQILGTIAGDDTVLLIARDTDGAAILAAELLGIAERGLPAHLPSPHNPSSSPTPKQEIS